MTATATTKPTARVLAMGRATRDAYGEALLELGRAHAEVYALDADLSKSTKSAVFGDVFPDRFLNVGIAEANMVSIACGLASTGKRVFCSSFAVFVMAKAFDQLRVGMAYSGLPIVVVGSHGGISLGEDGPSQMSIEDFGLAMLLPGCVVCCPADEHAMKALVRRAYEHPGGVYIRASRPKAPIVHAKTTDFQFGRAVELEAGTDVTLVATGLMVGAALQAHDLLRAEGVSARVLDAHTIRPLDHAALERAARETGAVVVAEEHLVHGGLASAVALSLAERTPAPIEVVGLTGYAESGTPDELFDRYHLRAADVAAAARKAVARKRRG